MSGVFADTAFYVAIMSPRDALNTEATKALDACRGRIVTTEFVLLEVSNFFKRQGRREAFLDLLRDLRASDECDVIPATAQLFERGVALFADRLDKEWSLTDCISFVVMQELGLTDALAADRHFGQAGFRPLLRPEG